MTHEEMLDVAKLREMGIPDDAELIDDCFYVWETRFGLHSTTTKQGRKMLTGLGKDNVVNMTRWHLKCEQDGTLDDHSYIVGDAFVSGKL
jgi:hypothetical protein